MVLSPNVDRIWFRLTVHGSEPYTALFAVELLRYMVSNTVKNQYSQYLVLYCLDLSFCYLLSNVLSEIVFITNLIIVLIGPRSWCTQTITFLVQFILFLRPAMCIVDDSAVLRPWECLNTRVWELLNTFAAFYRTFWWLNFPARPKRISPFITLVTILFPDLLLTQ